MNDQKANAIVLAEHNPVANMVITSHLVMRNGQKTQMLTFIPTELFFDDVAAGINCMLESTGNVVCVQHELHSLKNGQIKELGVQIYPSFFDLSRHSHRQ